MCGRYGRFSRKERFERLLGMQPEERGDIIGGYNIAPRTFNWIALRRAGLSNQLSFESYEWGLLPAWAKDPKAARQINARAETVAAKPMFQRLLREQRGLVPADGYYEWKATPAGKLPYWFTMAGGAPFFFAALWDRWGGETRPIPTFTLLTTEPNELTGEVHDRMPVIVRPEDYRLWLDPEVKDPLAIAHVLRAYPVEEMEMRRVSTRVNDARAAGPELIQGIADDAPPRLF